MLAHFIIAELLHPLQEARFSLLSLGNLHPSEVQVVGLGFGHSIVQVLDSCGSHFDDLAEIGNVSKQCCFVSDRLFLGHTVAQDHHLHIHFLSASLEESLEHVWLIRNVSQPLGIDQAFQDRCVFLN